VSYAAKRDSWGGYNPAEYNATVVARYDQLEEERKHQKALVKREIEKQKLKAKEEKARLKLEAKTQKTTGDGDDAEEGSRWRLLMHCIPNHVAATASSDSGSDSDRY